MVRYNVGNLIKNLAYPGCSEISVTGLRVSHEPGFGTAFVFHRYPIDEYPVGMAVYTDVSDTQLRSFIAQYDIGALVSCEGIAEGVENSNYLLKTTEDQFILTLYEQRVQPSDLPFFLKLMEHLAVGGFPSPAPVHGRDGQALRQLCGRPAALVSFLNGTGPHQIKTFHCTALGQAMAHLHLAAADFPLQRDNDYSIARWRDLADKNLSRADQIEKGLSDLIRDELAVLETRWPHDLPRGIIHADLFPDNVFFIDDDFSGIIDYYFACYDFLAYDLAIGLNAWCFNPDGTVFDGEKSAALLRSYAALRPLEAAEIAALPILARGGALRFLLTRLHDWFQQPAGALVRPKNPRQYIPRLLFHRTAENAAAYGLSR